MYHVHLNNGLSMLVFQSRDNTGISNTGYIRTRAQNLNHDETFLPWWTWSVPGLSLHSHRLQWLLNSLVINNINHKLSHSTHWTKFSSEVKFQDNPSTRYWYTIVSLIVLMMFRHHFRYNAWKTLLLYGMKIMHTKGGWKVMQHEVTDVHINLFMFVRTWTCVTVTWK